MIVGRCSDYILRDREDALHAFIYADAAFKAERIVRLYGESEKAPEERLKEKDKKRSINYKHFTGREWGDPDNYEIMLEKQRDRRGKVRGDSGGNLPVIFSAAKPPKIEKTA